MNLTKLASEGYDLKVQIGEDTFEFKSVDFTNGNQLYKLLSASLAGFGQLKKSTFYGVKFEETAPGVYRGERRIQGQGYFTFTFFAGGTLTVEGDCCRDGLCDGIGGCGAVSCKARQEPVAPQPSASQVLNLKTQEAANSDGLQIESGFTISELGSGVMSVYEDGHYVCNQSFSDSGNLSSETVFGALLVKVYLGAAQPSHNLTFTYDEDKGAFVATWEEYTFEFRKAKPTLKETFLGWLKNILG